MKIEYIDKELHMKYDKNNIFPKEKKEYLYKNYRFMLAGDETHEQLCLEVTPKGDYYGFEFALFLEYDHFEIGYMRIVEEKNINELLDLIEISKIMLLAEQELPLKSIY